MRRRPRVGSLLAASMAALAVGCGSSETAAPRDGVDATAPEDVSVDTARADADGAPVDASDGHAGGDADARDGAGSDGVPADADAGPPPFETHCLHARRTFYVAPTGSDGADGSAAAPWATLTFAASKVGPGDTVVMRGGTYRPTARQELSSVGTAADWICFEAAPGETPVWVGDDVRDADVVHVSGEHLVFRGATIRRAQLHGIEVEHAKFVDLVDDVVTDSAWAAISIGPSGAEMTSTTDVRVHGCTVSNNGLAGSAAPGVSTGNWPAIVRSWGATRVSFTANLVHENYGEGIDFILTDQGEASDNVAFDNYSVNLYLDNASHITVARNFLYWTGTHPAFRRKDSGNAPSGLQMSEEPYGLENDLVGNVVVDNVIVGCSSGLNYGTYGLDRGMTDSLFAGNTVYAGSDGGPPLALGDSAGHRNNRVADNVLVGGPLYAPAPGAQFAYDHNLFFDVTGASRLTGAGDVDADPRFVSPGALTAAAYRLRADSPARGAGVAIASSGLDFGGQVRADPPTLGAWELP